MSKKYLFNAFFIIAAAFLSLNLISCSAPKKIKYFQDIPDSGKLKQLAGVAFSAPTIQADDILTILIETVDPQATTTINMGNVPIQGSATPSGITGLNQQQLPSSGYLVNKDGYIEIPVLGRIKLLGHTTEEAKSIILAEANKYFNDPTVIVRYANFKFSVTGEVLKPGVYISPNEKVTVMDAIAQAGDLTIFAKRDNVLLIRENADGSKTPYRINLNKSEVFASPYYYLRQNDVLYVEPGKGKAAANDANQARTFALLGSLISVLIVVASRINL
jgi:polysaccharide export outer membrane protein